MRQRMEKFEGKRIMVLGTFSRFGTVKNCMFDRTALLLNLMTVSGNYLTTHLWCFDARDFMDLEPVAGDTIRFSALVVRYWHGAVTPGQGSLEACDMDYALSDRRDMVKTHESEEERAARLIRVERRKQLCAGIAPIITSETLPVQELAMCPR